MRASPVVTVLVAAMFVLAGCGDGDDDGDGPAAPPPDADTPPQLAMTLHVDEPVRAGEPVAWSLDVTNEGESEVTLRFADGRSGDVVLSREGEEVYRWSDDRAFTQVIRDETVAAGATVSYELEEPNLAVAPGAYDVTATLAAEPAPPPVERTVEIEG